MTEEEKKLVINRRSGQLGELEFKDQFPLEKYADKTRINAQIGTAILKEDFQELELLIYLLLWVLPDTDNYFDSLNKLLVTPGHQDHQEIARRLQALKSPSTIPYIRKALLSNFDYLAYTGSDSDAIAKWFSWLLVAIGTDAAVQVLKECSHSSDVGIRNEMTYRLKKLGIN